MSHANAPLTPTGRLRLARCVVEEGWLPRRAAERFGVSVTTARKWARRYRQLGKAGMIDRSSRPQHSPTRTPRQRERRVLGLRVSRRWGPARIAYHLGMQPSTVHKILSRYGCVRLAFTDPATGAPVRAGKRQVRRFEHAAPGDLVHVDIKKLGRIPDGGGHKVHGRAKGRRNRRAGTGYWYIHNAVDDHSRLAYTELLEDERKETAAGFWHRAHAYFADAGITVRRVLTDNGSCYRSHAFADALGPEIRHKRTRPYRPQTNGKVERYNRTMLEEWAYAAAYVSESDRAARLPAFLHHYNFHRGHTALRGTSPADRVHNLRGQYS
ncbi:IS481 family transposase [Dietzia massiliensis]|uniref:IS481 family transposase n=1 Tax=Dietzia massiliensis TaxID=2697499 RepID=UPI001BCF1963|nr:IS481 family transposase [Dietzia massiliensis]MBS7547624.1 IS481 family transposase [Dietzia massiliensis]